MIDILILTFVSVACYIIFKSSLRKAHMNQKMYEEFLEKGRQRKIDILYGRDSSD